MNTKRIFINHIGDFEEPEVYIGCPCGNLVSCTCQIETQHAKNCRYRRAATLPFDLECEHGFQACPVCDPCTCGELNLSPIL